MIGTSCTTTKEAHMASKTLTARESIEAAFAAGTERKLKTAAIIERVDANPKSKIPASTISTQLHRQAKASTWIKKVAPGTFQLIEKKAPAPADPITDVTVPVASSATDEVEPDPKPTKKARAKVAA
jgi:hypothetical protein